MWLAIFYVFAILCIVFVVTLIHIVSRSKFRDGDGDTSFEVGFEEDPVGNLRRKEFNFPTQEEQDDPHMGQEKLMQ